MWKFDFGKLNWRIATQQLKTFTCNRDAIKLIIDSGTIENEIQNWYLRNNWSK